jgi:hypothetical protein
MYRNSPRFVANTTTAEIATNRWYRNMRYMLA